MILPTGRPRRLVFIAVT